MEPYLRKPGLNLNLDNLRKVHGWRPKFFTLSLLNEGYKCTQFETNPKDSGGNHLVISHGCILMAAQKCKKKKKKKNLLIIVFLVCIFERLQTQNPTNQGSQFSWFFYTILKSIRKLQRQKAAGSYFCLKMILKLAP